MALDRENLPRTSLLTSLRLLSEVNADQCWIWTGALTTMTRPQLKFDFDLKTVDAHYLHAHDASGGHITHTCKNFLCVNPDHMEIERPVAKNEGKRIADDVKDEIYRRYQDGGWSQKGLAFKYGVSPMAVFELIKARRRPQDAPSSD